MSNWLSQRFQSYQAKRQQPAAGASFQTGSNRPMVNPSQAFPGFGGQGQAANMSWLNGPAGGPPIPRPQVPLQPNSTGVAGGYNPIGQYNKQYNKWLNQNRGPNQFQQGQAALLQDVANNNYSQNLQFQQGQQLYGQAQGAIAQAQGMVGVAEGLGNQLEGHAAQTAALGGQAVEGFNAMYGENREDLMSQLGASNSMGDAAVASFQEAKAGYRDMAAQNVSAMLGGMGNDLQTQMQSIQSGMNPDGSMMTPEQQAEQMASLKQTWNQQRYGVATQLLNQQNETMAKLTQDIGTAQLQAGGLRGQNASTFAGFAGQSQGQFVDASNQRLMAQDMANNLYSMSANMKNGAQMLSIDRQLAGMQMAAQMARDFPYSPTSMFDVYLNLMQLQASGAGNKAGFKFPKQGVQPQLPQMV